MFRVKLLFTVVRENNPALCQYIYPGFFFYLKLLEKERKHLNICYALTILAISISASPLLSSFLLFFFFVPFFFLFNKIQRACSRFTWASCADKVTLHKRNFVNEPRAEQWDEGRGCVSSGKLPSRKKMFRNEIPEHGRRSNYRLFCCIRDSRDEEGRKGWLQEREFVARVS